ncbi:MAG: hydantoinase/oxoprolinase family protein [Ardenticatenales bacterium]|nr:hydantoinase/oxoprolinase family protein [Ardenticatenales bacterium]
MGLKLGIDTGGTHTDFVLLDSESGQIWTAKVPSTPADPLNGVLTGLAAVLERAGATSSQLAELTYGTTIVVNMLVQQQAMQTGLITTRGFRDVLEIGRAYRQGNIYDLYLDKPEPLVPRDLRLEVTERLNFRGEVLTLLDEDECRQVIHTFKQREVNSIAVCLLHSYANPSHEQRLKELISAEFPEAYVSLSSEINPVFREYERTSTTVVNARVMPAMVSHLTQFTDQMQSHGVGARLYTMQANGGKATFAAARQKPVHVINSGPVGGVIAGAEIARQVGCRQAITLDMGGTSCDVALLDLGQPVMAAHSQVAGYPVQIPSIDLNIVGAGGGSIAWLDSGGGLRVGPRSAGAEPGPVCYGRGGTEPTVTDANLVTGRLNPDYFLQGAIRLDEAAAHAAIRAKIAEPLGISTLAAAAGILAVANATMVRAIKLMTVERGFDPRDFTLIAFGGAGPLHALQLAEELEIPTTIVPRYPGNTSALGLALADIRHDYAATRIELLTEAEPAAVEAVFARLEAAARAQLAADQLPAAAGVLNRFCDLRYYGQGFELTVPVAGPITSQADLAALAVAFHEAHRRSFGHANEGDPVEMVNLRVSAAGEAGRPDMRDRPVAAPSQQIPATRSVFIDQQPHICQVYRRSALPAGATLSGPAIVEQAGSTTLLLPRHTAKVDPFGNLVIALEANDGH